MSLAIDVSELWDADASWKEGRSPWTIFAYPRSLADAQCLPFDLEARRFLAELQSLGLRVGVWAHPEIPGTVYFVCPFGEKERIARAISELERLGTFPPGFPSRHSEHLFSIA